MPQITPLKEVIDNLEALAPKLPEQQKAVLDKGIGMFKALWGAHEWQVRENNRLNRQILALAGELENPATQADPDAAARNRSQLEFPGYLPRLKGRADDLDPQKAPA